MQTNERAIAPAGLVALVQGASRGIGLAVTRTLLEDGRYGRVFATCRRPESSAGLAELRREHSQLAVLPLDVMDTETIAASADALQSDAGRLDLLFNSTGILHEEETLQPEKRLADVDPESMDRAFRVNAVGPLLVARFFERILRASPNARFAVLSARVGSIGDNRRGGWYAYRASKAALNMLMKTLAIEWARLPRPIGCFALHPGTVATELSKPFRKNLAASRVFTAAAAAENLLNTLDSLGAEQTGGFFAYDGSRIEW